jgi:hypothetical protein
MTGSFEARLLSIGHSNLPADGFMALLKEHGVTTVVDDR